MIIEDLPKSWTAPFDITWGICEVCGMDEKYIINSSFSVLVCKNNCKGVK